MFEYLLCFNYCARCYKANSDGKVNNRNQHYKHCNGSFTVGVQMQKGLILPGRVWESFRKVVSWIEGWVQVRNSGKCLACPENVGELRGAGVEHNRGSLEVRLGKRAKDQWQKPSELHSLGKQEKPQPWVLEDGLKRGKNRSKKPVYSHKGLWLQQRLWYWEAGRETWETFKKRQVRVPLLFGVESQRGFQEGLEALACRSGWVAKFPTNMGHLSISTALV